MRHLFGGLSFLLLMVAALAAGASDLVVISSDSPGLEPGQVIAADSRLEVPTGTSVTVVAENGQTLTLNGPFSGAPRIGSGTGSAGSLVSSLSALLSVSGSGALSLGTMRSGQKPIPDDPWTVPVDSSATRCLIERRPVTLWRNDGTESPARFTITDTVSARKIELSWSAGEAHTAWPADLPPVDGGVYFLHRESLPSARRVVIRLIPPELPTDAHRIVWMAGNGCRKQAQHLLSMLR